MNADSGFLLINKPPGSTSHDIIDKLRRITGIKKIGHAGTLDPFASGLLIVAIGRDSTREISQFVKLDKKYSATLFLGAVADTYDLEGKIINTAGSKQLEIITKRKIKNVLEKFIGAQKQIPPMFSAKKINGRKLYTLARKGIEIERKSSKIEIYGVELVKYDYPELKIKVKCSSGTYIRSLAHDVGKSLGCGAYLEKLERTAIGEYKIKQAISLANIEEKNWKKFLKKYEEIFNAYRKNCF